MTGSIDLTGLDKSKVLAALYNASKPQGMGFLHFNPAPMTSEEASDLLEHQTYFDYLNGRVMKIDLSGDRLDAWGYDRDNGAGAAEMVIGNLRRDNNVNSEQAELLHLENTRKSAQLVEDGLNQQTTVEDGVVTLGLADAADLLYPIISKILSDNDSDKE